MNTDYKLVSKVIANRIKLTLDILIHKSQTGFVKGRQISENLRKFLDIIEICENTSLTGVLVCIDFQKAFDKVEYPAAISIMKWFNFGDVMTKWIQILFSNFSLSMYNNAYVSSPFQPTKGLFQGNPIAPYLFIMVIELLATKLRKNGKIRGLKIEGEEFLLTLFADDLGLILPFDEKV